MMMQVANVVALRATCPKRACGAVLVRDGRILSTGYNGAPVGQPHCDHTDGPACKVAVHAEANAILFAARHGAATAGTTMYLTDSPCRRCAGFIINAGVTEVVYARAFTSLSGVQVLRSAGISVRAI
jgi:dCMP deaminase